MPHPKATPSRSQRGTATLPSMMMRSLERRATEESLTVASVVRRAVAQLVLMHQQGTREEIDLAGIEENERRGLRGPVVNWPDKVSYVLDTEVYEQVRALAEAESKTVTDIVREAVAVSLVNKVVPVTPATPVGHGFVTKDRRGAPKGRTSVLDLLHELDLDTA